MDVGQDQSLLTLIGKFAGQRVVVLGEAMLDTYLEGPTTRICREAPVPVVDVEARRDVPGGAANSAVNLAALGANVVFLSATGDDAEGAILRGVLETQGVASHQVLRLAGRRTLAKHRIIAGGQMVVRYDQGSTGALDRHGEQAIISMLEREWAAAHAVIVSDYDYGLLTAAVVTALARLQSRDPRPLVIDARRPERYRAARPSVVKPNFAEVTRMLDSEPGPEPRSSFVERHRRDLLDATGAHAVCVTMDREGALLVDDSGRLIRTRAPAARHPAVAGAGDTFASVLAVALAAGAELQPAAELASAAAAVVVAKDGTAVCSSSELTSYLSSNGKAAPSAPALTAIGERARRDGRRIVFTNGCFDILHSGHVGYLAAAREMGDMLVVGVNSDASVKRLKGRERPINSLSDRLRVLAALDCIDHLAAFEEDTPETLIRALQPDVFVKGGDYTEETLPEAALVRSLGGDIRFVPFSDDRSTTGIIERIRASASGRRRSTRAKSTPRKARAT